MYHFYEKYGYKMVCTDEPCNPRNQIIGHIINKQKDKGNQYSK
jgi:hypothetical protein